MPRVISPDSPLDASATMYLDWDSQEHQYPKSGPPGPSYFPGHTPRGVIDCLLWRSEAGELVGILNHYPFATPEGQQPGSVNIWVKPGWRRRGIATRLGDEAFRRWDFDAAVQSYTPDGAALTRHFLSRHAKGQISPG